MPNEPEKKTKTVTARIIMHKLISIPSNNPRVNFILYLYHFCYFYFINYKVCVLSTYVTTLYSATFARSFEYMQS